MLKLTRSWLSLLVMLLLGTSGCGKTYLVIPEYGTAFVDQRDTEGSATRLDEFYWVCIKPGKLDPPELSKAPLWCAWTMEADKVIRANNAKVPN